MSGMGAGRTGRGTPYAIKESLNQRPKVDGTYTTVELVSLRRRAPECDDGNDNLPEIQWAHWAAIRMVGWVCKPIDWVASLGRSKRLRSET